MRSACRVCLLLVVCLLVSVLAVCGGGGGGNGDAGSTYYADADGDGRGDRAVSQVLTAPQAGWVADSTDCDDGASSCTDDCVSDVDGDGAADCRDLCLDTDQDGYGVDNSASVVGSGPDDVGSCTSDGSTPCAGTVQCLGTDCDDDPVTGALVNPGQVEACDDEIDNDCGGDVDCYDPDCGADPACAACTDSDGDGYLILDPACPGGDDCDDGIFEINPGGTGPLGCPTELCSPCLTDADCGAGNRCVSLDGAAVCAVDCSGTTLCPEGFTCTDLGGGDSQCLPLSGSCDCLPSDDGQSRPCEQANPFGTCSGTETCDPLLGWVGCTAATPEAELCDGADNDCDGVADNDLIAPLCPEQDGVCQGSRVSVCGGASGWLPCGASDYGPSYEASELTCDGLDNDCDGITDEGALCDDGVACTTDVCGGAAGCFTTPDSAACDDGIDCTVDVCDAAAGCLNTPDDLSCPPSTVCVTWYCVPSGCQSYYEPSTTQCGTGTEPHTIDVCDGTGSCVPGPCEFGWYDCDGGVPGCETNIQTDVNNCGGCNVVCDPGQSCVGGACV